MSEPSSTPPQTGRHAGQAPERRTGHVVFGLFAACALLLLIELGFRVVHFDKHPYFRWEQWPGFYAVCGFAACILIVFVAKFLVRPLVKRSEDYYDR